MSAEVSEVWAAAREDIRASVPDSTFELWLEPLRPSGLSGSTLILSLSDPGRRDWVERRYLGLICDAVKRRNAGISAVSIVNGPAEPSAETCDAPLGTVTLNSRYTFNNFVIGPGNHFAHAAALAVAEVPAQAFNPLFLYAPPGMGKTHLMNAIAAYISKHSPHLKIAYLTAEGFTNGFLSAVGTNSMKAFKSRLRGVDVLLVDDVHFLANKVKTQEEFFHTFNALHDAGAQIVLSADRLPHDIASLAERLQERFAWGLVADMARPDFATRRTILARRANGEGISIPHAEALDEIANLVSSDVRRLEGALTRVAAVASLRRSEITPDLVREIVPGGPAAEAERSPVVQIQNATALALGLPAERIVGADRSAAPVFARQVAMYLTRELTDLSLPGIGRAFGGRDHATVHHAIRRVGQRMSADSSTADLVGKLLTELRTGLAVSGPDRTG